uniref:HDC13936 n=1 Tax=Drosophila melanogaster TaxID=7227 RepID=Q6IJZ3_DROME|nr:TPA_inf: HDC13936 [Drosophila melanogaster]
MPFVSSLPELNDPFWARVLAQATPRPTPLLLASPLGAPLQRTLEKAEKHKNYREICRRQQCVLVVVLLLVLFLLLLLLELLLPAALRWWILMERFGLIQNSFVLLSLTNLG